jgi:hypothetical protein
MERVDTTNPGSIGHHDDTLPFPTFAVGDDVSVISTLSQHESVNLAEGSVNTVTDPSIRRLWKFCQGMPSSVKLVLPDSLRYIYYMPLPKGPKPKTQKDIEREEARLEYISQREIKDRKSVAKLSNNYHKHDLQLSPREQYVN